MPWDTLTREDTQTRWTPYFQAAGSSHVAPAISLPPQADGIGGNWCSGPSALSRIASAPSAERFGFRHTSTWIVGSRQDNDLTLQHPVG
jgi:hypothetical protein